MAIVYTQTDSNASCTAFAVNEKLGIEGGAAGSVEVTYEVGGLTENSQGYAVEIEDDAATFDGGNITARISVTTPGATVTWDRLQVFRLNSACATQDILGDFDGLAIDCSTTGVKSTTQTISAASGHSPGDKIFVLFLFDNSSVSPVTLGITPSQDIDTPFTGEEESSSSSASSESSSSSSSSSQSSASSESSLSSDSSESSSSSSSSSVSQEESSSSSLSSSSSSSSNSSSSSCSPTSSSSNSSSSVLPSGCLLLDSVSGDILLLESGGTDCLLLELEEEESSSSVSSSSSSSASSASSESSSSSSVSSSSESSASSGSSSSVSSSSSSSYIRYGIGMRIQLKVDSRYYA